MLPLAALGISLHKLIGGVKMLLVEIPFPIPCHVLLPNEYQREWVNNPLLLDMFIEKRLPIVLPLVELNFDGL